MPRIAIPAPPRILVVFAFLTGAVVIPWWLLIRVAVLLCS